MKLRSAHSLLLLLPFFLSFRIHSGPEPYRVRTIVIDAGHGGRDGATHGVYSKEKDVALSVSLRLGRAIENTLQDVRVIYTRVSDTYPELHERAELANKEKADLFISIHCNSMPDIKRSVVDHYVKNKKGVKVPVYRTVYSKNTTTRGVETFVAGSGRLDEQDVAIRENASILLEKDYKDKYEGFDPNDPESYIIFQLMKNTYREQSIRFASLIQDEYVATGRINRGVKEQNILILQRCSMPAVLTEIGFISNPQEEDYINSEAGQNEIVSCLLNAIQAYKRLTETE
jgi:N-acetylmuramoyl-L-alanine amidase